MDLANELSDGTQSGENRDLAGLEPATQGRRRFRERAVHLFAVLSVPSASLPKPREME